MGTLRSPDAPLEQGRWIWALVFFAALVLAIHFLSLPMEPAPKFESIAPLVVDAVPGAAESNRFKLAIEDPAVFALPSSHGFSRAWLDFPTQQFVIGRWTAPHQPYLPSKFDPFDLVEQYWKTNQLSFYPTLPNSLPRISPEFAPLAPLVEESALEITGPLLDRAELARKGMKLPSWPHAEPLQPSVVQVGVLPSGIVLSAALLGRSGLPVADQLAMDLAQTARFEPLSVAAKASPLAGEVMFGRLTFRWAVQAQSMTNLIERLR
ncbi:MAG: energy transducer TonB [Pedosphaera sp.]|nr:energy transducer TonB [Pedosphaera sp.]MSU40239.1 energy transducer TonB [Pedosphaera sp.]